MPAATALPLSTLATEFYNLSRPVGLVIALEQVQQQAVDACRFYGAYGRITAKVKPPDLTLSAEGELLSVGDRAPHSFGDIGPPGEPGGVNAPENTPTVAGSSTLISLDEWAIIKPLFVLYVEHQNAMSVEATRGMGVDPFGRSVSEVTSDIALAEETVMTRAFFFPIFTV